MSGRALALALCLAMLPLAGAKPVAPIPFKQDRETTSDLTSRVLAALLACGLIGAAGVYVLRRRGVSGAALMRSGRRVQVVEVHRLGTRGSLVLLRWDDEEILIAQGEGGQAQVLGRRNATLESAR